MQPAHSCCQRKDRMLTKEGEWRWEIVLPFPQLLGWAKEMGWDGMEWDVMRCDEMEPKWLHMRSTVLTRALRLLP